jgi:hypothetical protein
MTWSEQDWRELLSACRGESAAALSRLRAWPWPALAEAPAAAPGEGEPYGRLPLFWCEEGEVLLMRWREGRFCAPHDHGDAGGFVALLRGEFVERSWRLEDGALKPEEARAFSAPDVLPIGPRRIHDMRAQGGGLSVHIYQPPIRGMKVYDRSRRETLIVTEDCGAWVPSAARYVVSREPWPEAG